MKKTILLILISILYIFLMGEQPSEASNFKPSEKEIDDMFNEILNNDNENVLRVFAEGLERIEREAMINIDTAPQGNNNRINWTAIALWAGASILAYLVIRYGPSLFDFFKDTTHEAINFATEGFNSLFNPEIVRQNFIKLMNDPKTFERTLQLWKDFTTSGKPA